MKRTSKALDWIIQSMVEKGAGAKGGPPQLIDLEKMKKDGRRATEMFSFEKRL